MNHDSQHSEHDGASVTPKEGEQADRGMTMPLPPPLGTILMVGVLSAAILAAVITILVFMLPAAN